MSARWWISAVWALVAASALFWGLKLFVRPPPVPPHAQVAAAGNAVRGDLTRLLGADAPPPAAAPAPAANARFRLVGVVAPRAAAAAREGVALIAVDGKPPRAFRVGAAVDGQTVLQSVAARGATLGSRGGDGTTALAIAPPAAAATGVLPGSAVPVAPTGVLPGSAVPLATPQVLPPMAQPAARRAGRSPGRDEAQPQ